MFSPKQLSKITNDALIRIENERILEVERQMKLAEEVRKIEEEKKVKIQEEIEYKREIDTFAFDRYTMNCCLWILDNTESPDLQLSNSKLQHSSCSIRNAP